jgi:hypothetical protein
MFCVWKWDWWYWIWCGVTCTGELKEPHISLLNELLTSSLPSDRKNGEVRSHSNFIIHSLTHSLTHSFTLSLHFLSIFLTDLNQQEMLFRLKKEMLFHPRTFNSTFQSAVDNIFTKYCLLSFFLCFYAFLLCTECWLFIDWCPLPHQKWDAFIFPLLSDWSSLSNVA